MKFWTLQYSNGCLDFTSQIMQRSKTIGIDGEDSLSVYADQELAEEEAKYRDEKMQVVCIEIKVISNKETNLMAKSKKNKKKQAVADSQKKQPRQKKQKPQKTT